MNYFQDFPTSQNDSNLRLFIREIIGESFIEEDSFGPLEIEREFNLEMDNRKCYINNYVNSF